MKVVLVSAREPELAAELPADLDDLLRAAATAQPGVRIEFRDRLAAHGAMAIPTLAEWLPDPRLGAGALADRLRFAGTRLATASETIEDLRAFNEHVINSLVSGLVTPRDF